MKLNHKSSRPLTPGFTLLEMVVVMLVLTLLLGSIFAVIQGTVQLTNEVSIEQNKAARLRGLHEFCDRLFKHLPSHSKIRLRVSQKGNLYLSELTITDPPPTVSSQFSAAALVLHTEQLPSGYLRLELRLLDSDQLAEWERGIHTVGESLVLLEDIAKLEWSVYQSASDQWETLLNAKNQLLESTSSQLAEDPTKPSAAAFQRPQLIKLIFTDSSQESLKWLFTVPIRP